MGSEMSSMSSASSGGRGYTAADFAPRPEANAAGEERQNQTKTTSGGQQHQKDYGPTVPG